MPPSEGRTEGSALEDEMNKIFTVFPAPRSPSSLLACMQRNRKNAATGGAQSKSKKKPTLVPSEDSSLPYQAGLRKKGIEEQRCCESTLRRKALLV